MALTGTFDDVNFAELLQMLNIGNKTGKLSVQREGESAVLHLHNGNVIRAVSRRDTGPELVYKILGWRSGDFSFERSEQAVIANIKESTESLILEGAKRFDEWERVEEEMPDMHIVLRQRAFAVNERYEELSEAAQAILRLVDARRDVATIIRESGLEPIAAVTAVTELLSEGIVEQWSGTRSMGEVLSARGRLPDVSGEIDISAHTYFSSKERLEKTRATARTNGGDSSDTQ
jgi:hypothetical protein